MPEQHPDHRFARAAGRATRAFLDASRQDAEAARTARTARTERGRARETTAGRADAGRSGPGTGVPVLLTVARWWWAVATALFALLAVSFLVAGLSAPGPEGPVLGAEGYLLDDPLSGPTGQFVLAGAAGVLAVAAGIGTVQLLRSRRGAAGLLTGVALVVGVPLALRGHPALITIAVVLLAGAALLWLPPVRRRLR